MSNEQEQDVNPEGKTSTQSPNQGANFKHWYESKKDTFNEQRKNRYATDEVYRERVKARRRETAQRAKAKGVCVNNRPDHLTTSLTDVIEGTPFTAQQVSNWVKSGYIPTPEKFGNKYWFTDTQKEYMSRLFDVLPAESLRGIFANPTEEMTAVITLMFMKWSGK